VHTARGLTRAHRVVFVAQHNGPLGPDEMAGFLADTGCLDAVVVSDDDCEREVDPAFGPWPPVTTLVRDLLRTRLPRHARLARSRTFRALIAEARRRTGASVAWVFDPMSLEDARAAGFATVLLDLDDLPGDLEGQELRELAGSKRLPLLYADHWRLRRWERALPRRCSRVLLAKDEDRGHFAPRDRGRLALLPNGVRMPAEPAGSDGDGRTLLFVGTLDYTPNEDALRHLLDDVLPLLRARRPDVRVQVVGRGVLRWLRERVAADPQMALAESAPDLRPYYEQAALVVAPIRLGAGTRIKVLEALGHGKALVATRFGAEGCGLIDGTHLGIADGAEAFAARCDALLGDAPARAALGRAGRAFVAERYDWAAIEATIPALVAAARAER
jgi:glycosyltransferase involved in cell wall biosynthesis